MSQIKLKHSGGNSVIIAAPDSNPASDRTLKLPSDGDGTILTTNSATGKILQVVQAVKTDTQSVTNSGYPSTTTALVGLQPSLTPSSSSNKILVSWSIMIGGGSNSHASFVLSRSVGGSDTDNILIGDANELRVRVTQHGYIGGSNQIYDQRNFSGEFLDTPSTPNAVTYKLKFKTNDHTIYVNRSSDNSNANWAATSTSLVTLKEVAA